MVGPYMDGDSIVLKCITMGGEILDNFARQTYSWEEEELNS